MSEPTADIRCHRCGEPMKAGYATAIGLIGGNPPPGEPKLVFVVSGEETSLNPVTAFEQGLRDVPADAAYAMRGYRCPACGTVELLAVDRIPWTR